ncbi:class I SAM-dependent methyltransferase [Alcaligenes faecalis]|uniref:methyltransferase regulatory domain-containing protein n=1 Tax=Alcaligenes faecalis TaxID=511 RepID=UPI000F676754|nr:class I SAM-dependent methyltransferase [Alcaligenes faecalis]MBQ0217302.1 class I SAM-dependent methyltransferase [Alcaligenes faecalis]RSE58942.1 methyltransferase domain-containing protein [Alcaligenes faecalis]
MNTEPISHTETDEALDQMNQDITDAYDTQVYTSNAFSFSSPGHLRAASHLWGLESVPLENARVLELGCAGGGNLLPFAVAYPKAHVVGIDLSSVQVEQGQRVVQALGLKNLHLHAMSLTDITPEFGQFDYIIAHGVFSWVPPEVREAMMRIMRENLSPSGIGYISYNTYPGWKAGDIVRDAMLLHSHGIHSGKDKLAASKAMLNLLSDGIASSNSLAPSLRTAVAQLRKHSDYYLAHEYLETFNSPCYLLEFASMAQQYDMVHVGDSEPHLEMAAVYGQNVQLNHSLLAMGQPREMRQQYLDFAVGRNFRKSLLVHQERAGQILMAPELERLADLRWAGQFTEIEAPANAPKGRRSFRNYKNNPLHTSEAPVLAVIQAVTHAWPASVGFDALLEQVRSQLPSEQAQSEGEARKAVLSAVQTLFRLNSLRYTLEPSPYDATEPSKNDVLALVPGFRHVLEQGKDPVFGVGAYNLWHESARLQLQEAEAWILLRINGKSSRKQLATLLRDALSAGKVPGADGKSLKGQRNLDATADKILGKLLEELKRLAVLM